MDLVPDAAGEGDMRVAKGLRRLGGLLGLSSGHTVMFHVGRCGSTVLTNLLGQHPDVRWDGELFEQRRFEPLVQECGIADPRRLLRHRIRKSGEKVYGFETKFLPQQHLARVEMALPEYVTWIRHLGVTRVITLERRNVLRRIVSGLVAREKARWQLADGERPSLTRVHLHPEAIQIGRATKPLLEWCAYIPDAYAGLHAQVRDQCTLQLVYEEDVLPGPEIGYRRMLGFLGLDDVGAEVRFGRQNPFALTDVVINYAELEGTLGGTAFEWMLRDEAPTSRVP